MLKRSNTIGIVTVILSFATMVATFASMYIG